MSRSRLALLAALGVAALLGVVAVYFLSTFIADADESSRAGSDPLRPEREAEPSEAVESAPDPAVPGGPRVLVVTVDGLSSEAVEALGSEGTPALHRMIGAGSSTLNARTAVEKTETLPNHIGMVTGLPVDAEAGGHGVTWNDGRLRPARVQNSAGRRVASIFSAADRAGLDSAVYASKPKFSLMQRSWPTALDDVLLAEDNERIVRKALRGLRSEAFDVALVHFSLPDEVGHASGWMSPAYLRAVRQTDRRVGRLLDAVSDSPELSDRVTVILTADHGGDPGDRVHAVTTQLDNYRIPFFMWGPEVARGADLYELSPELADPGRARVGYRGAQPVRNGFVANAAAELLGLPPLSGSTLNASSELNWN